MNNIGIEEISKKIGFTMSNVDQSSDCNKVRVLGFQTLQTTNSASVKLLLFFAKKCFAQMQMESTF